MMRTLLAILLFPLLVQAAGEGMWQASSGRYAESPW